MLEEILQFVCDSDGDKAILTLSLVGRRWQNLVSNSMFRRKLHFRWLSSVYDWNKASKAFREKYYVMYDMQECLGCRTRYKDAPGFMKRVTALRFYSGSADEGHPGYCSHYCAQQCGAYFDLLDDWQA